MNTRFCFLNDSLLDEKVSSQSSSVSNMAQTSKKYLQLTYVFNFLYVTIICLLKRIKKYSEENRTRVAYVLSPVFYHSARRSMLHMFQFIDTHCWSSNSNGQFRRMTPFLFVNKRTYNFQNFSVARSAHAQLSCKSFKLRFVGTGLKLDVFDCQWGY